MLRILLLFAVAVCAFAVTEHPAGVAGIYEANIRIPGTAGKKVTLTLAQDGKATMRSELVGKTDVTEEGTWSAEKEEVRVDLAGKSPLVWRLKKGKLSPKDWDHGLYGKSGLTLRRPR